MTPREKQALIIKVLDSLETSTGTALKSIISTTQIAAHVLSVLPLGNGQSISNVREHIYKHIHNTNEEENHYHTKIKDFCKLYYKNLNVSNEQLIDMLYNIMLMLDNRDINIDVLLADRIKKDYECVIPTIEKVSEQIAIEGVTKLTVKLTEGYVRINENKNLIPYKQNNNNNN